MIIPGKSLAVWTAAMARTHLETMLSGGQSEQIWGGKKRMSCCVETSAERDGEAAMLDCCLPSSVRKGPLS